MNRILAFLFLVLYVVTAKNIDCSAVRCKAPPDPDTCPAGSRVKKPGCCSCCLDRDTQKCVDPVDCRLVLCAPPPSKCPKGSVLKKKGCCECCVNEKTDKCVQECPQVKCAAPPEPSQCPLGTKLDVRVDPQTGCSFCKCCLNKKNQCVPPLPIQCRQRRLCPTPPDALDCGRGTVLAPNPCCSCCVNTESGQCQNPPDCRVVRCGMPPDPNLCPQNSTVERKGCCPCCLSSETHDCVDPIDCNLVDCRPPPAPMDCSWGSVLKKKGCCDCCVDTETGDCVDPPDCRLIRCLPPPSQDQCPPGTTVERKGCCLCCFDPTLGDCVKQISMIEDSSMIEDPKPEICPAVLCRQPPKDCPTGSVLKKKGCCDCCVDKYTQECVWPPEECPMVKCAAPPDASQCPPGTTVDRQMINGCPMCPCCLNSNNECVDPFETLPPECAAVSCLAAPEPEQCPEGSVVGTKGCCPCCVDSESGDCVEPRDCSATSCPVSPDPDTCPSGSSLEQKGCCGCCLDHESQKCVEPLNCAATSCLVPPKPLDCPIGSVLRKKGCCDCCVHTETEQCVEPFDCALVDCAPMPANSHCPADTTLTTKGCCPCCLSSKTGDCVDPIVCPMPGCVKPPETCPIGSTLKLQVDPITGCEGCICCVSDDTGYCVSDEPACLPMPCPFFPEDLTCPSGSKLGQPKDSKTGCPLCPCCLRGGKCVDPVKKKPVICPKPPCFALPPGSHCPPKTNWDTIIDSNGCERCPCCVAKNKKTCVDPIICPLPLCIEPPPASSCPKGSTLKLQVDPKTGCEMCICCVDNKTSLCVNPGSSFEEDSGNSHHGHYANGDWENPRNRRKPKSNKNLHPDHD